MNLNQFVTAVRQKLAQQPRTAATEPFLVLCPELKRFRRATTAEASAVLADRLAQLNPETTWHVWTPDNQAAYEVRAAKEHEMRTADVPNKFEVNFYCLCELYAVNPESYGFQEDFSVEIYRGDVYLDDTEWHVGGSGPAVNLTDIDWAPQSDEDAAYLYQECSAAQNPRDAGTKERPMNNRIAGFDTDESLAVELHDWIVNDYETYRHLQHMQENMANKMAQGVYDSDLAVKQFFWAANAGAKSYAREFGGTYHQMFPKNIRMMAAEMLRDDFEAEVEINPQDFAGRMPKKHLPEWEKRYNPRGATAATNKENTIMTQRTNRPPMSRNRRRRLASRVERARSRTTDKRRFARRQDNETARLERRVASLTRLLRKAELELRTEERTARTQRPARRAAAARPRPRPSRAVRERQARVREIRARLERENGRRAATSTRRLRRPTERRAEPKRPIRRRPTDQKVAPKVIRTKTGKVLVRIDD